MKICCRIIIPETQIRIIYIKQSRIKKIRIKKTKIYRLYIMLLVIQYVRESNKNRKNMRMSSFIRCVCSKCFTCIRTCCRLTFNFPSWASNHETLEATVYSVRREKRTNFRFRDSKESKYDPPSHVTTHKYLKSNVLVTYMWHCYKNMRIYLATMETDINSV